MGKEGGNIIGGHEGSTVDQVGMICLFDEFQI
jgi:hypothetical protein